MKKYAFFFSLHVLTAVLWSIWALPSIGESGSFPDEATWIAAQIVLPVFIIALLARRYRPGFWLAMIWGLGVGLSGAGLLGWALMGTGTPASVYTVAGLLLFNGLGVLSSVIKDMNWIRERNRYAFED